MNRSKSNLNTYYQALIDQGGLRKIRATKQSVIEMELNSLGEMDDDRKIKEKELAFIQKKISYLFNSRMYAKIAVNNYRNKKNSLLIPPSWYRHFCLHAFEIDSFISRLKWTVFLLLLSAKSVFQGLYNAFKIENYLLNRFIVNHKRDKNRIIILNSKFPTGDLFNGKKSLDFGAWYLKQVKRDAQLNFVYFSSESKNYEVNYNERRLKCISFKKFDFGISYKQKIKLIFFAIKLLIKGLLLLIIGKCETLVGYLELIIAKRFSLVCVKELPDKIVFSDNHGVLMPIWVNELKKSGVQVDYIFFSSYDSPTVYDAEDPRQDFWKLNSWPKIICVDQYQADFMNKNLVYKDQKVEIGGFPLFSDCDLNIPVFDRFTISLFDFEPGKDHLGISTISECGYNTFEVNENFMSTVYEIAQELDAVILHKPKRRSNLENRSTKYKKFIKSLDPQHYISLAPEVSAARLILNSNSTISMPISTPSLIANYYGKKSLYFDPLGKVMQSDPALRGIPLAGDPTQLRNILIQMKKEWAG